MFMLFNGKHPFFQSKMTSDEYKRKIKIVKFPTLNNKYFFIYKLDLLKILSAKYPKLRPIKDIQHKKH